MADNRFNLLPSVLDRLMDDNPDSTQDAPRTPAQQLTRLRNGVRRDLEALLNTEKCCVSPPVGLGELALSVIEYGTPDFLSVFTSASQFREEFRKALEDTIRRFEPRFFSVKVSLKNDGDYLDRTLRFRIDAMMYAEPAPEPLIFDSQLDPASHVFSVTEGRDV